MKKTLKAIVVHFAANELAEMIHPDTMSRIKAQDPNPVFKAFAVAHEGEATAEIVGTGRSSVLKYFRDAIIKIGNALTFGTSAFYRHEGNDGTGNNQHREAIGELVGKTFRDIAGKLHAIAAFYIYPKFAKKGLNAASYEAEIEMSEGQDGVRVDGVSKITGVALSDQDRPGFPGATLMATMQAFSAKKGVQHMEEITLSQVKAYIRAQGVAVTDLFSKDELRGQIEEWKNATSQIKRLETELQTEKDAHLKTKDDGKKQLGELSTKVLMGKADNLLETISGERKLSSKQKAYAKRNMADKFKPQAQDEEGLKNEMQKYIDGQVKDYDEFLKAMDMKPEEHGGSGAPPEGETDQQKTEREAKAKQGKGAAGAGDGKGDGKDFSDPKNNDLIPQESGKA